MEPTELNADFQRLGNRIRLIKTSAGSEDMPAELISLSANFICIDICGRLEQNLKSIFSAFGSRRSNRVLDKAIADLLGYYQNPRPKKIVKLVTLFDTDLAKWIDNIWQESGCEEIAKKRLDNLIEDRIILAHSKKTSHTISATKLKNYFDEYKEITSFLTHYFLSTQAFQDNKYSRLRLQEGRSQHFNP